MPLIDAWIQVKDVTGAIGNTWKDGETMLIIKPSDPPTTGTWKTGRGSDIHSSGGSPHATYWWWPKFNTLFVQSGGYEGDTQMKIHLMLVNFREIKCGLQGEGKFHFRGKEHTISWKMISITYADGNARCES
jgi:hypothetical protein